MNVTSRSHYPLGQTVARLRAAFSQPSIAERVVPHKVRIEEKIEPPTSLTTRARGGWSPLIRLALVALVLVAVMGVGCVTSMSIFPIEYKLVDLPEERRIELSYRNDREDAVCLVPQFWPNQAGKIDNASDEVFLVVGDQRFAIEEFNTGYCPACYLRVEPAETVRATIGYNSFGIPDYLVNEEKRLEFTPMGARCGRKEGD